MIRVHDVSKTFLLPREKKRTLRQHVLTLFRGGTEGSEPLQALRGVGFEVHRGEFFSVIGKNGSGKSTLLKLMAGIYAPDTGSVALEGTVSPFLELGIGFNPELTARENVFLSAAVLGLRRREVERLYDRIIGFAELERFQNQALKNFSSGMHVRLAFSVAFMVNADILLIDEVLAVGDASFQQKCYDVFRRLKREGKTIIFVSHGMNDVKEFSDRVMLLHEGRIVSIGEPVKVIHDYQLLTAREDERRMAFEESRRRGVPAGAAAEFVPPADGKRWGKGGARVGKVALSDAAGREKRVYATGDLLRLSIDYRIEDPALAEATAVVAIHRADGVNVIEARSPVFGAENAPREGTLELVFSRLELLAGIYYFDVALAPVAAAAEPYDFLKGCGSIRVFQDTGSRYGRLKGMSYLDHEWKVPGTRSLSE